MKNSTRALILLLSFGTIGAVSAGEIYKWIDSDGNTHYQDLPTEGAVRLTNIISRSTDPQRVQAATQARHDRSAARTRAAEAASQGRTEQEVREEAEQRAGLCANARTRLEGYITSRRLYRHDENGDRVYLPEDEVQTARDDAQGQVEEFCS